MINLGNKIRELRKQKGLTQEQLASALNISSQAVSKWEMNAGYPDMTLIPIIAGYFKVTLDTLFDFDVNKVESSAEEIRIESNQYFWNNFEKAEEILRDGIKAYPASDKLKTALMELYEAHSGEMPELREKAIAIADRIIDESQDIFSVCSAKIFLVGVSNSQSRYEEAKETSCRFLICTLICFMTVCAVRRIS